MDFILQTKINDLLEEKVTLRRSWEAARNVKDFSRMRGIAKNMAEIDMQIGTAINNRN